MRVTHADAASTSETKHFFTVDVEEYFQVYALSSVVSREDWDRYPRRLSHSMPRILEQLARHDAKGTFFILGWVAQHSPDIVRAIAAAGHEIASHGFWHQRVTTLSPSEFREDIRASKSALEDVSGNSVTGYRAPSFSIVPGYEWAFDALLEEGYRYDSSLFPIHRRAYGYPGAPRVPHIIQRPAGQIIEIPLATTRIAGLTLPAAGGAYLRQLPFWLTQRAFTEASARGVPATFYLHPWEIDPGQPSISVGYVTRMRHYRGLGGMLGRVERLLQRFRFTTIASYLDSGAAPRMTAAAASR